MTPLPIFCLRGHTSAITSLRFIPYSGLLASGDQKGELIIWSLYSRLPLIQFKIQQDVSVYEILWPEITNSTLPTRSLQNQQSNTLQYDYSVEGQPRNTASTVIITQSGNGEVSTWDISTASSSATLHPINTIKTNASSYARAFLIDPFVGPSQLDVDNLNKVASTKANTLYCMAPIQGNSCMGLFDLARMGSEKPCISTGEISTPKEYRGSHNELLKGGPGWVVGGSSLPTLSPFYCLLAYQCFGCQAVFDLRQPKMPVTNPLWINSLKEETISIGTTRNISWSGTVSGRLMTSKIDVNGQIYPTHQLDLYPEFRTESSSVLVENDPLELKLQTAQLMENRSKFGIGAIKFRPDSRLVAIGSWNHNVRLFDVMTKQPLETLRCHTDSINALDFDVETGALVVGSKDMRVSCWNIHCGSYLPKQQQQQQQQQEEEE